MNFIPAELRGRNNGMLVVRLPGGVEIGVPVDWEPRLSRPGWSSASAQSI